MARDLIVGLDAGTSVIKAAAFDLGGEQLAVAARPNRYERGPDGAAEQDMARTWADAAAVLRDLAERVADLPARVAAVAVTGQGDGTWLIDRAGEPVAPGWLWLDSRAAGIVEEFARTGVRDAVFRRNGCGLAACQQSMQLAWLRRHRPTVLARAATAFHCKDWLYFRLTGERATDVSEGVFTFGDFRTRQYARDILDMLDLADLAHLLPPLVDGTERNAPLAPSAAAATGLPAGLPVVLGAIDVLCSALGGGVFAPGRSVGCSIIGSTGIHLRLFARPDDVVLAAQPSGWVVPFPVPGHVAQMQSNMAATLNIDWVVGLACQAAEHLGAGNIDRAAALRALDAAAGDARPGATLFHPYIDAAGERGPFVDVNARAQLSFLARDVGFAELARAVYEGLALAARDCYAAMGALPQELRIAGGGARSPTLKRILASVLGAPVRQCDRAESGAAGAAMMAAVAIGAYPDMAAASAAWVDPVLGQPTAPDAGLAALYDRLYPIYVAVHRAMPPAWRAMAELRQER